ncbi:MAG: hypothetical protein KAT31_16745, partial [Bacteroidales bacterium]|nr:hypothetical protein [Bacteroidales bacterium]
MGRNRTLFNPISDARSCNVLDVGHCEISNSRIIFLALTTLSLIVVTIRPSSTGYVQEVTSLVLSP